MRHIEHSPSSAGHPLLTYLIQDLATLVDGVFGAINSMLMASAACLLRKSCLDLCSVASGANDTKTIV